MCRAVVASSAMGRMDSSTPSTPKRRSRGSHVRILRTARPSLANIEHATVWFANTTGAQIKINIASM